MEEGDRAFRSASSFKKGPGNDSMIVGAYEQDIDSSDFAKKSETIRRLAGIQDTPFSRQSASECTSRI
jgi:hypothetical protein